MTARPMVPESRVMQESLPDRHYRLAMRAAREMRRSRCRAHVARRLCRHLRSMLDAPGPLSADAPTRRLSVRA